MIRSHLNKLIFIPRQRPQAKYRIFCFPYAGGSSATYIKWLNLLHENLELACIELPGRGSRFEEPCYTEIEAMVKDIADIITDYCDKEIIFYGHSMGAKVAYYVADILCQRNIVPWHMFISGSGCPGEVIGESIHQLPDAEFIGMLKKRYGFPNEVLNNSDLMNLVLPKLKADFKVIETAELKVKSILPSRATILSGTEDSIKAESLYEWKSIIGGDINYLMVNGDHFFVDHRYQDVVCHINSVLNNGVMNNGSNVDRI